MVQRFTASGLTIVAIIANTEHFPMIQIHHRFPTGIIMTGVTDVATVNVTGHFTLRIAVVMTGYASLTDDIGVIELNLP